MTDAWEYLAIPETERDRLAPLGREGWELVATGGHDDERWLFLKRRLPSFRERVTLEQRSRYYAAIGRSAPNVGQAPS